MNGEFTGQLEGVLALTCRGQAEIIRYIRCDKLDDIFPFPGLTDFWQEILLRHDQAVVSVGFGHFYRRAGFDRREILGVILTEIVRHLLPAVVAEITAHLFGLPAGVGGADIEVRRIPVFAQGKDLFNIG